MTAEELRAFSAEVKEAFLAKRVKGPIHLSGGNEEQLVQLFTDIRPVDWIFSSYRSHYHALLHGVSREEVMEQILEGRSMNLCFPAHRFYTSAIVAGQCPAAVGAAWALKRQGAASHVWCFVGDMASQAGICIEAANYAAGHELPITFVIEDNGLSTNTPTAEVWGVRNSQPRYYKYERTQPHTGAGQWVKF